MLTVEMTSIPASSSSSMSCQRFSLRDPGTLVCASSSTRATLGRRAQHGVDVHLGERGAAVGDLAARHDLETVEHLGGVLAAVRLDEPDDDVGAALGASVALAEHGVGLADAGRSAEVDPQPPARHALLPSSTSVPRRQSGQPAGRVQSEVELEDVDPRLAEEPEDPTLGVLVDQGADLPCQAAFAGDACDLLLA